MLPQFPIFDYHNPQLFVERLLAYLPELHRRACYIILEQPEPVFLVGGIVRDFLLGRENFDLDFVTLSTASRFVQKILPGLETAFGPDLKLLEHPPFGTVRLELTPDLHIDFATARKETYPQPAVLPVVTYPVIIEEDLRRRDFTINTLAFSPTHGLHDPYNGLQDLREGWLRILHPQSFRDDPTRMIRGVRFAARLGYRFETATEQLLIEALGAGYFELLSAERKRNELRLILKEFRPAKALRLLTEYGLMQALHPLLDWQSSFGELFDTLPTHLKRPPAIFEFLTLLLHNSGQNQANQILSDLRFFGVEADIPLEVARLWETVQPELQPDLPNSRLHALLHNYKPESLTIFEFLLATKAPQKLPAMTRYFNEVAGRAPILNGYDLQQLGVPRGPLVGKLLGELRNAVLNNEIAGREAEEKFVRNKIATFN